jgi:hypothetical protein
MSPRERFETERDARAIYTAEGKVRSIERLTNLAILRYIRQEFSR